MERVAFLFLCFAASCQNYVAAQRPSFGRCPKVSTTKDIKIDKFLGRWYEIERSFYIYELIMSCTTLDIARPDNATKELEISITTQNKWTGRRTTSVGKATPKGDGSAVLDYSVNSRLPQALARFLPGVGRYAVLATDHDTYAVIYSCSDIGYFHADLIWILGRKSEIPIFARAAAYEVLTNAGFNTDHLTISDRKNCPET